MMRERASHIFDRDKHDWYQEPKWTSERLFDVEKFDGDIIDPACGGGNIVMSARDHGYNASGFDIVDRGFPGTVIRDFLKWKAILPGVCNLISNPPFGLIEEFAHHAIMNAVKVALICPVRRLPAARWLEELPLLHVWMLTPRPSMPTGDYVRSGGKVGGGTVDYCWLVFERGYSGSPRLKWLHRDVDRS